MFKLIKDLFSLLDASQRKRLIVLQFLVILMAILEIIGVASIIPFMSLVGDIDQLKQDTLFAKAYQFSGLNSENYFIFALGLCVLLMLFLSTLISMYTTWRLAMFANKIGMEIADRLYSFYLKQNWLFHASGSSAQLTKKIATETQRVTSGILVPLVHINSKFVLALFLSLSIFVYDPIVASIGSLIISLTYLFLFKGVRARLQRNGSKISKANEHRFRLMNEGFGGIKEVLLLGRDSDFIDRFRNTGKIFAYSQGANQALALVPRYFMELVAFGSMIILVLYFVYTNNGDLGRVLPLLSVYALATVKLLPALQQIYGNFAQIKGAAAAFNSIHKDLLESSKNQLIISNIQKESLKLKDGIELENISFTYPNKDNPALNCLNMYIPVNSVTGIVGPSGSGKSTLIDILLSLIEPNDGYLKVDDKIINEDNKRLWQSTIGFVSQSIFLSEGTIAENIAFGLPEDQINNEQIHKAVKLAHLTELVDNLENGIKTKVGERGVQISGGQRQRIGIARALYHEPDVLVFDEATSSLDGITEKLIMEAIYRFSGQKTIIMIAHRLKTVEKCDQIFFIDNGRTVDKGSFQELIKTNDRFKKMAQHT